jgi:hypothetical protein
VLKEQRLARLQAAQGRATRGNGSEICGFRHDGKEIGALKPPRQRAPRATQRMRMPKRLECFAEKWEPVFR